MGLDAIRMLATHAASVCAVYEFGLLSVSLMCRCLSGTAIRRRSGEGKSGTTHTRCTRRVGKVAVCACDCGCSFNARLHTHTHVGPANATTFHTVLYTKPALHRTNECFIYDKYLFILLALFQ